jgi:hypothetical protein
VEPSSPKTFQINLRIPFSARYLVALFLEEGLYLNLEKAGHLP